ncbi:hypothetical protein [Chenggangzhangella methanolivorans]|uniref:Uncharacterized protein n=1 Tax=Chenggangzhangella methanolivorans TaxID=1437009 RepID=A0A9E6REC1_9HYPH|nr:hypothetical protein [Chenggangzhangella methanolivorans]QZO01933.1 hypothetical protein K6K41_11800 [Chenggangzhangella methanolivorans]
MKRLLTLAACAAVLSAAAPSRADESVQQLVDILRAQSAEKTAVKERFTPAAGVKVSQVQITVKINIRSDIPADAKPTCSGYLLHNNSNNVSFQENATMISTRKGATATCVLTIPFAWPDANLAGIVYANASIYWGAGQSSGLINRSSSRSAVPLPMPPEGGTAKTSLDFTL